jgi:hypothetical protein
VVSLTRRLLVLLAGCLLLVLPGAAFAATADVRLRIEGATTTLLERTALRTTTTPVNKDGVPGHDCTGTSAAGALELGVAGDWSGTFYSGLGYTVERVRTETHAFPDADFFELWVNNKSLQVGICGIELQEGDDVLLLVARCEVGPAPDYACLNDPVLPLGLAVPATAAPGAPFNVSVVEYSATGVASPVAGATISGGDAPVVTNAAGVAAVVVSTSGPITLKASKPGRVRSAGEPVCATTGSDGLCGSAAATAAAVTPAAQAPCATNGHDGRCATRDATAPAANILGISEGRRFGHGFGPRELRARVDPDPSGLLMVKLRLTRTDHGRCSYFSGKRERFVVTGRGRCHASDGLWFAVGDREQTSYLLPRRLPSGRYVLDVNAIDKAYNRDDARRRGGNRVVFHVG